jgi:hypothetical protein
MISFEERLLDRFRKQSDFSRDYSPLYGSIFTQLVGWMTAETAEQDPLVEWLLTVGEVRQTLDVGGRGSPQERRPFGASRRARQVRWPTQPIEPSI